MTSHKVWYEKFCKRRDNRALYIGSKDEQRGNQLVQLVPMVNVGKVNSYVIQIRKNTKTREYVRGICNFKYMGGQLAKLIVSKEHGISYRIKFHGKKCYLQAMVTIDRDSKDFLTRSTYGTIGLDYNDGFLEMAETNETGNLIKLKHIDLKYHSYWSKPHILFQLAHQA